MGRGVLLSLESLVYTCTEPTLRLSHLRNSDNGHVSLHLEGREEAPIPYRRRPGELLFDLPGKDFETPQGHSIF